MLLMQENQNENFVVGLEGDCKKLFKLVNMKSELCVCVGGWWWWGGW